jgi:Uma2 family endonuclease
MTAAEKLTWTHEAYLAAEERAAERHDFIRGEVFAMSGGTPEHSLLTLALGRELSLALRGQRCLVFDTNMRLRNEAADFSCYPDASVVCGTVQRASDDRNALANPGVVFEVLSDSTEAYDRGDKSREYRAFKSIREIVLVSQKAQRVEVFRRNPEGNFVIFEFGPGSVVVLDSIGVSLPVADLYREVEQLHAQG